MIIRQDLGHYVGTAIHRLGYMDIAPTIYNYPIESESVNKICRRCESYTPKFLNLHYDLESFKPICLPCVEEMTVNTLHGNLDNLTRHEYTDPTGEIEIDWYDQAGAVVAYGCFNYDGEEDYVVILRGGVEIKYSGKIAQFTKTMGVFGGLYPLED